MKSKISWYREVLEYEPHSKVFFPLARLLKDNGQLTEALATLRDGLSLHPEHVEAKLLLAEVLREMDREDELHEVVQELASSIAGYPAFWEAWADQLNAEESGSDPALALKFLASFFSGASFTWAEVIESGLRTLLQEHDSSSFKLPKEALAGIDLGTREEDTAEETEEEREAKEPRPLDGRAPAPAPKGAGRLRGFESTVAQADVDVAADEADEFDEENEEAFSLRTRTMADLLAEQGDYEGALDIYRELHSCSRQGAERDTLERLIEEMRALAADKPGANGAKFKKSGARPQQAGSGKGLKGKKKLISALEALAQRLEAKAAN